MTLKEKIIGQWEGKNILFAHKLLDSFFRALSTYNLKPKNYFKFTLSIIED